MRKARDDSTWAELTPEQRELVEEWLFDENLGYAKTVERVKAEFGLESTIASVGRYYRRRARERQVAELALAQLTADELNALPVEIEDLREATLKLMGKAVLKLASERPDQLEQLAAFTRLLLLGEENEIRRGRLELARECFDHDTRVASLKDLPHLRSYLCRIADDESLSHEQKLDRLKDLLFGWEKAGRNGENHETDV